MADFVSLAETRPAGCQKSPLRSSTSVTRPGWLCHWIAVSPSLWPFKCW